MCSKPHTEVDLESNSSICKNGSSNTPTDRNVDHSPYCIDTKHDMLEILKANSKEVDKLFEQIQIRNEDGINTHYYSLMPHEHWQSTPFDTNIAESAHAMINRTGKPLKLKTAILRGWKHDDCIYMRIQTHQQTGVPMSSKDKSDYGKKVQANKRSSKS
ncbi:hypothetical protein RclHR1_02970015 [Rhizophagus clarus]|uniref:Uncharacterized protein n=1 Tax=Rhizophagus clarus TaxID=94130 RepID=A0A2Z6R5J1_9GLOM|nr:hypothetical protein RclHR1_02970015 [Rhizophagus clarus]GES72873.1 hypothetical protein GLOIN_2v1882422 [Rhizophagus clarus]